jgi:hypothetical protein
MPFDKNPTLPETISTIFTTTSEKVAGTVSAVAITSPLWLQQMKLYSDIAEIFMPILGCIYLSLQIGFKLLGRHKREE